MDKIKWSEPVRGNHVMKIGRFIVIVTPHKETDGAKMWAIRIAYQWKVLRTEYAYRLEDLDGAKALALRSATSLIDEILTHAREAKEAISG